MTDSKDLPTFKTERLVLRPLEVADGEAMHACFSDPDVMTYWSCGPMARIEDTIAFAAQNATHPDFRTWAITEDGGDALGWVTLMGVEKDVTEIGYILRRDCWSRGYVSEAVPPVIAYGFEMLGVKRLQADIDPDNAASIRLAERLGFRRDRYEAGTIETHIGLRDSVFYVLDRPDQTTDRQGL